MVRWDELMNLFAIDPSRREVERARRPTGDDLERYSRAFSPGEPGEFQESEEANLSDLGPLSEEFSRIP
jgi:hypothetical protein